MYHAPGTFRVLGISYHPTAPHWDKINQGPLESWKRGHLQAVNVLKNLAEHRKTAEHIAFKLVHHFITDNPTTAMVDAIADVFDATGGDLKKVALALLLLPAAWSRPLDKIRTPYELIVAQFRAVGNRFTAAELGLFHRQLRSMNNMVWACPSVEGYSDDSLVWLSPDGIRLRVNTALVSAKDYGGGDDYPGNVTALADDLFDAALSSQTRERIRATREKRFALTILFSCPEIQRR